MRVSVVTAGFLLTTALVSISSLAISSPAQAQASKPAAAQANKPAANKPAAKPAPKPMAAPAKPSHTTTSCVCDKPKARPASVQKPRRVARSAYYDYGSAGAYRSEWHGQWQVAPDMGPAAYGPLAGNCCAPAPVYSPPPSNCCAAPAGPGPAAYGPGPAAYGPPPEAGYDEMAGLQIDPGGWSGGVGGDPEGGGGGGGYGQVHLGLGGNLENGPTYNSYNQSFQFNPSQAGPFRPRLMGGFAPPPK